MIMNARHATQSTHATALKQQLPVHILRTKNREQEDCYFILRASTVQYNKLMAKRARESVNIADYGEILASGYGRTISAQIIAQLREKYGIELPQED